MAQKHRQTGSQNTQPSQRLDKWLWYTRLVKSRTLATTLVGSGKVRINNQRVTKPSHILKPGDVITATIAKKVRILKVLAPGHRRGPAIEAQGLYNELTPEPITRTSLATSANPGAHAQGRSTPFARPQGAGRPTKRERRLIDRFKGRHSET